jgi:hypothetical protein
MSTPCDQLTPQPSNKRKAIQRVCDERARANNNVLSISMAIFKQRMMHVLSVFLNFFLLAHSVSDDEHA